MKKKTRTDSVNTDAQLARTLFMQLSDADREMVHNLVLSRVFGERMRRHQGRYWIEVPAEFALTHVIGG